MLFLLCVTTPESYRDGFRSARIGSSDIYQQFAVQLGRLFDHWFDSRGIPRNFDDLREFLIVDQLLSTLPVPLRVHIKEQDKHTLNDIVKIADSWTSAHKGYFKIGPRVNFIAGKNTGQTSSQSSTKSVSQSEGNKTSDYTSNCLLWLW